MSKIKDNLPGMLLSFGIAIPSWILGKQFTLVGGPVFAILIGILLSNTLKIPSVCNSGIKYTSKKMLQFSIILLGFSMNLFNILELGGQSFAVTIFTILASLITAFIVGKALKVEAKIATLIGIGTSICGGSAIAASAPVINASDEEICSSISTIFLFNIIAVLIFPAIGRLMQMTDTGFGVWAGTAINDTSSVVAAGQVWGTEALKVATIVKLARTLMILPITLILAIYTSKKENIQNKLNILKIFPWFILGFVLTSIITTANLIPGYATKQLATIGKFIIVAAMAAIGLNTNLKQLIRNGIKPITLGISCWTVVAIVSIVVQKMIGIY